MSNFLMNLVAKSTNQAPGIQPRLPSRFEPLIPQQSGLMAAIAPPSAEGDLDQTNEVEISPSPARPSRQPLWQERSPLTPEPPPSPVSSSRPPFWTRSVAPLLPPEPPEATPIQLRIRQNQATDSRSPKQDNLVVPALTRSPRPSPADLPAPVRPALPPVPPQLLTVVQQVVVERVRSLQSAPPVDHPAQPAQPQDTKPSVVPVLPHPIAPRPVVTPIVSSIAMPPPVQSVPEPEPATPPPMPTIQVTIGRIEVRSTPPSPPPPSKATPSPPAMSLEDYLRSSTKGGER